MIVGVSVFAVVFSVKIFSDEGAAAGLAPQWAGYERPGGIPGEELSGFRKVLGIRKPACIDLVPHRKFERYVLDGPVVR